MEKIYETKYKDRNPFETVIIIKNLLLNKNILTTEKWLSDEIHNLYSVKVEIDNTNLFSNGKGTTKIYALASAYGELIERLQNKAFFSINTKILHFDKIKYNDSNEDVIEYDEKKIENLIINWLSMFKKIENNNSLIPKLKTLIKQNNNNIIRLQIFNNIENEKTLILPYHLVNFYYGTNGMSAGNSKDEALVQGISEILERYVIKQVIIKKITPPLVSKDVLNNFPSVLNYIKEIEEKGPYKIELRDLSLGIGIPAIGLILFNIDTMRYFVKIAVHPIIDIAMERCFTELLQGKKLKNYQGMSDFTTSLKSVNLSENILDIFVNGEGLYPYEFFLSNSTYECNIEKLAIKENKDMYNYLINIIKSLDFNIYINDTTNSPIYSYQVIIPGMSEIFNIDDEKILIKNINFRKICDYFMNLESLSKEQASEILEYINTYYYDATTNISTFLPRISLNSNNVFNNTNINLFCCLLSLYLNDYKSALSYLKQYLKIYPNCSIYYKCLLLYLTLTIEGYDNLVLTDLMDNFFDKKLVNKLLDDLNNYPLKAFKNLNCNNNCIGCNITSKCKYNNELNIYNIVRNNW